MPTLKWTANEPFVDVDSLDGRRTLRMLVATTDPSDAGTETQIVSRIWKNSCHKGIAMRTIHGHQEFEGSEAYADEYARWADLLVVAPVHSDTLARMLHGIADNLILRIIRGWDISKRIILVPGMSTRMWENPMTKKQLSKLRRKWHWVQVMQPILWTIEWPMPDGEVVFKGKTEQFKKKYEYEGHDELIETIEYQAGLMKMGQDNDLTLAKPSPAFQGNAKTKLRLPPEIWTIILEYLGDWEIANALGIFTKIKPPLKWLPHIESPNSLSSMQNLEWIILTHPLEDVVTELDRNPEPPYLSHICVELILKFSWIELLAHLEAHHQALFLSSFGQTLIPTKASAVFGKTAVLDWWKTSPSFLAKEYTEEAVNGASGAGFVHVLDWWRKSGLPMKYSERALEQSCSHGHIHVLEWWKAESSHHGAYFVDNSPSSSSPAQDTAAQRDPPLKLKVGKSICFAAQKGQADVIRWLHASGIPYSHEETVAKIASASGHTNILELWKELKGQKMIFDNQVLVAPTKNGHAHVLEWWKNSSLKVEYKTCDIEEALEDCINPAEERKVKCWWAMNGLNLSVRTSEWMQVKVL